MTVSPLILMSEKVNPTVFSPKGVALAVRSNSTSSSTVKPKPINFAETDLEPAEQLNDITKHRYAKGAPPAINSVQILMAIR